MRILIFTDDEVLGKQYIVIDKITSYGLTITEFKGENGRPSKANVWVQDDRSSYTKPTMSYDDALKEFKKIDNEIVNGSM